jgi:hypothetical protein
MRKVTVEITETGWKLKAEVDGEVYEEVGTLTEYGSSQTGDPDDAEWMSEELYDALNDFFCHNVSEALREG